MPSLSKRWIIAEKIPANIEDELSEYHPVFRQILYTRGYHTQASAEQFIQAGRPEGTEPRNLLGIQKATDRINHAISHRERIAIYGDYDTDGVTATALLVKALTAFGADVVPYIPNRFDEGYGLNNDALQNLYTDGIRLVITVDCGIRSIPEVEFARQLGLDLIVSDHHTPFSELPPAYSIINPKQPGDPYPYKDLAGVGLAYKIACAVAGYEDVISPPNDNWKDPKNPNHYLDLVALGTVADLVPLTTENRALVKVGLEQLRKPHNQGILSLIHAAGISPETINTTQIGFILGPRLNAAGRLDSAMAAVTLLLSKDSYITGLYAQDLDNQNRERQEITRQIQIHAEQIALSRDPDSLLLFASHPDFNSGVVGLAASRLCEQYYRPSIVAYQGEEFTRASCRSIPEFDITKALDTCADLMEHHGGHSAAAGFTVRNDRVTELIQHLQLLAQHELEGCDLRPSLNIDIEIPLRDLRPEILRYIDWMQPTGFENEQPVFVSRNLFVKNKKLVGRDGTHLKLVVSDGFITYDAIAFRQGEWFSKMPSNIDIAYTFERNEFNGRFTLQLNILDIKPSEIPD